MNYLGFNPAEVRVLRGRPLRGASGLLCSLRAGPWHAAERHLRALFAAPSWHACPIMSPAPCALHLGPPPKQASPLPPSPHHILTHTHTTTTNPPTCPLAVAARGRPLHRQRQRRGHARLLLHPVGGQPRGDRLLHQAAAGRHPQAQAGALHRVMRCLPLWALLAPLACWSGMQCGVMRCSSPVGARQGRQGS